jgi:hypothetical protein
MIDHLAEADRLLARLASDRQPEPGPRFSRPPRADRPALRLVTGGATRETGRPSDPAPSRERAPE